MKKFFFSGTHTLTRRMFDDFYVDLRPNRHFSISGFRGVCQRPQVMYLFHKSCRRISRINNVLQVFLRIFHSNHIARRRRWHNFIATHRDVYPFDLTIRTRCRLNCSSLSLYRLCPSGNCAWSASILCCVTFAFIELFRNISIRLVCSNLSDDSI